jgi:hypothetical protein
MRRPTKISKKRSKKSFTKHAKKTHRKNAPAKIMRGGYRL